MSRRLAIDSYEAGDEPARDRPATNKQLAFLYVASICAAPPTAEDVADFIDALGIETKGLGRAERIARVIERELTYWARKRIAPYLERMTR